MRPRICSFTALIVLLLTTNTIPLSAGDKDKQPTVELVAQPRLVIWVPDHPQPTHLYLRIENATEDLWCPDVEWRWPDGTKSSEEGDCPPYEQADPADIAHQSWPVKNVVFGPGTWTVNVALIRAGHVIRVVSVTVTVSGGDE